MVQLNGLYCKLLFVQNERAQCVILLFLTAVDPWDNCQFLPNPEQRNIDGDGIGDVCDNCPLSRNTNQADEDHDSVGNVCDNCLFIYNPLQNENDREIYGALCNRKYLYTTQEFTMTW